MGLKFGTQYFDIIIYARKTSSLKLMNKGFYYSLIHEIPVFLDAISALKYTHSSKLYIWLNIETQSFRTEK